MMWKSTILKTFCLLYLVFSPSEVAKPVPPLEIVLVCCLFLVVEDFHSDSVVKLGVTEKIYAGLICASLKSVGNLVDCIFCYIAIGQKRKCLWGVYHNCIYVSNCLLGMIFCSCFWESKLPRDTFECIYDSDYSSCGHVALHTSIVVK